MPLIWIVLVSKSFYDRAYIITKYQLIFLKKRKFLKFILVIGKEAYFSILVEEFHPFGLEPKSSACFFRQIQMMDKVIKIPVC